jgi:hypothetical protein
LNTASPSTPATPAPSWDDAAAIYRRICLLRCSGRAAEAKRLESGDLACALQQMAGSGGETAAFATYRDGVFEIETERVRHAQAVAELLAPLLLERLGRPGAPAGPVRPAPVPAAKRGPVDIADMIDTLLAQQPELSGR